jgi:hypothetical protein
MIVLAGVGNAKAQRDHIQKRRLGLRDTEGSEIRPDVEIQLVNTGLERIALQQRLITAAIGVGLDSRQGLS